MEKQTKKQVEQAGMSASLGFWQSIAVVSFLLGLYKVLGMESILPILNPIADRMGLWWFAISFGGLVVYFLVKRISQLPSRYD